MYNDLSAFFANISLIGRRVCSAVFFFFSPRQEDMKAAPSCQVGPLFFEMGSFKMLIGPTSTLPHSSFPAILLCLVFMQKPVCLCACMGACA